LVDQLKREGAIFDLFSKLKFSVHLYILVSSSGVLHHHNVDEGYQRLVYDYPVVVTEYNKMCTCTQEMSSDAQSFSTVWLAWNFFDDGKKNLAKMVANKAQDFYNRVKDNEYILAQLIALIVSYECDCLVEGNVLMEDALDHNYFIINAEKKVCFHYQEYFTTLKDLVMGNDSYPNILRTLLGSEHLVNQVASDALGRLVEDALDLAWKDHMYLGWSQCYSFTNNRNNKRINENVKFNVELRIDFGGDIPKEEQLKDWSDNEVNVVYLKPIKSNFPGFDMFVVQQSRGKMVVIHAIQVTILNSNAHSVGAFSRGLRTQWETLFKRGDRDVAWRFHMVTPEVDIPILPPGVNEGDASQFDQISFADLLDLPACTQQCGVQTVRSFPAMLAKKRQSQREKES